jgi:dipeptidyl aminopeptidase/acylaminoacyl peptidase
MGEHPALDSEPIVASTWEDREAKYSPDGTRIVFISTRSGQPAVWRANSDGTNQILIGVVEDGVPGSPRWTPDGQQVVFDASSGDTGSDVYIVGAEGGIPRRITSQKGHEQVPSVSRDGRWVYYTSEGDIWKTPLAGGESIRVAPKGGGAQESADGRWLYFTRDNGLWRMPVNGAVEELFQPDVGSNAWALSAEEVYLIRQGPGQGRQLLAYNPLSQQPRVVLDFPPAMVFYAARWLDVSLDGRFALVSPVARDESDIMIVNIVNGIH